MTADRYVVRGTEVPQIYPGTLDGVTAAYRLAQKASRSLGIITRVVARYGNESQLLRVYDHGSSIELEQDDIS